MAYTAYVLTAASRSEVLNAFPPKFSDVIAQHVTVRFGLPADAGIPEAAEVKVVGYAEDESLEVAVVSVNGETVRPDGGVYHVTLSLDRSKGRRPKDAKALLAKRGYTAVTPLPVETTPERLK